MPAQQARLPVERGSPGHTLLHGSLWIFSTT